MVHTSTCVPAHSRQRMGREEGKHPAGWCHMTMSDSTQAVTSIVAKERGIRKRAQKGY